MSLTVLYFAWMRERIGIASEEVQTKATSVSGLVDELCARDDRYGLAFSDMESVRVAVDQELADLDAPISGAREVAFFPPMTGG